MEGGPRLSSGGCWVLAINPVTLASRRLIIFRISSIIYSCRLQRIRTFYAWQTIAVLFVSAIIAAKSVRERQISAKGSAKQLHVSL